MTSKERLIALLRGNEQDVLVGTDMLREIGADKMADRVLDLEVGSVYADWIANGCMDLAYAYDFYHHEFREVVDEFRAYFGDIHDLGKRPLLCCECRGTVELTVSDCYRCSECGRVWSKDEF